MTREFVKTRKDGPLFAFWRAIGDFLYIDAGVGLHAFQIFGAGVLPESLLEFADGYDSGFLHVSMVADLPENRADRLLLAASASMRLGG